MPSRLSTSATAHIAGGVAVTVYMVAWWWWLPDISQQAAHLGYNFSWLLLWLIAGVAVSYATAVAVVVAIRRVARARRRQRYQQSGDAAARDHLRDQRMPRPNRQVDRRIEPT
jgi:hypothetical protein